MIGCNDQRFINTSVSDSANADVNLRRAELLNHAGVIVSNIENIIQLFFCLLETVFKIHSAQISEGARAPRVERS